MAEISKFRRGVLNLITAFTGESTFNLDILDIGSGDDPLDADVDKLDLPNPYTTKCKVEELTYRGDARKIDEFVNKKYDVVFSSHLLEDFPREETIPIIKKWIGVLKDGGILVLLLPDQQRYEQYCKKINEVPNVHHQIRDFSLEYIKNCISFISELKILFTEDYSENDEYNFLVIARKIKK